MIYNPYEKALYWKKIYLFLTWFWLGTNSLENSITSEAILFIWPLFRTLLAKFWTGASIFLFPFLLKPKVAALTPKPIKEAHKTPRLFLLLNILNRFDLLPILKRFIQLFNIKHFLDWIWKVNKMPFQI